MIKAIVWDIGGVLLDDPAIGSFWKDVEGSKELRHLFGSGKLSREDFIQKASVMLNLPKDEFMEEYGKAYFPISKIEGVFEIYKLTKGKNYIFSDTNPIHLEFIKDKHAELFDFVEKLFLSPELGSRKSEEKSYDVVIKELGLNPSEILLIDDKRDVLSMAAKKGMATIFYQTPEALRDDLHELGVSLD
jgi:putative hydrolase of the HAD superfamily